MNGNAKDSRDSARLVAEFETDVNETGWFAARCFERPGRTIRFAHTSPIYIQIGSRARFPPEDAQFFIDWIDREIGFYKKETGFRDPSHREEILAFFERARAVYLSLLR